MYKTGYIDVSKLNTKKREYETYEHDELVNVLEERVVKRYGIKLFPSFTYEPLLDVFVLKDVKLYSLDSRDRMGNISEITEDMECYASALDQLSTKASMGSISSLAVKATKADSGWYSYENGGGRVKRTDCMDTLNQLCKDFWYSHRIMQGKRKSSVVCYRTTDIFPTRAGAFLGTFVHIKDIDVLKVFEEQNEGVGLDFHKAVINPISTVITYLKNDIDIDEVEQPVVAGMTIEASEFGASATHYNSTLFLPDKNFLLKAEPMGRERKYFLSVPHTTSHSKMLSILKSGVKKVLGDNEELKNMYRRVSVYDNVEIDFSKTYTDSNGNPKRVLQYALRLGNKSDEEVERLIKIQEKEGYPSSLKGLLYAVLSLANSKDKDINQDTYNSRAFEIISNPEGILRTIVPDTMFNAVEL